MVPWNRLCSASPGEKLEEMSGLSLHPKRGGRFVGFLKMTQLCKMQPSPHLQALTAQLVLARQKAVPSGWFFFILRKERLTNKPTWGRRDNPLVTPPSLPTSLFNLWPRHSWGAFCPYALQGRPASAQFWPRIQRCGFCSLSVLVWRRGVEKNT